MIDLHVHTTASDGVLTPQDVVGRAHDGGLTAIAITDHDTLDGVPDAKAAGQSVGVRVVTGCEFSVGVSWGELHLLGYFLPQGNEKLLGLFHRQRESRALRAKQMMERLETFGAPPLEETVTRLAGSAPIGRPHIARALVELGWITSVQDAFSEYIGDGAAASIPKELPSVAEVVTLVRSLGGVTSAAHLKARGTRAVVRDLHTVGVDAVEVLHPSHNQQESAQLTALADDLGMLKTGGSDWHGDEQRARQIGRPSVSQEWLDAIEARHLERLDG